MLGRVGIDRQRMAVAELGSVLQFEADDLAANLPARPRRIRPLVVRLGAGGKLDATARTRPHAGSAGFIPAR